ncbi:glycosyltransferase family 2 protein [Synechococcus sp. HB1133]|uniref:glycosyltransferase family A protein n=1 Tax=unclassified Synechococcus TaxID=2626047 RepID=UPI00140B597B|nr:MULTISPECIES: glycosyltransferase family A protein [unclassified Synechococcus]MCB4421461.1 glycosyltransferase family 2 protein [Synechococcus sp. HB1133]MCB4431188.1 glycosyltransferase family 2 protein [Synechococcus sp. HBA1120]NHI80403.1 glycosyltransferase family 2 protein [Synechococcus sp. HB1133]
MCSFEKPQPYKYSTIIPTRDRFHYLSSAVDSCLSFGEDVEILVSVNGTSDDLAIVSSFLGHRIRLKQVRLICTNQIVSMTESFDFAVKNSTGKYIVTLGDDDAVMFCFRSKVDEHFSHHPDSILTWYRGAYFWNDTPSPGRLAAPPWTDPSEITFTSKLNQLRSNSVSYNDLPNIYNSFIPRQHIEFVLHQNKMNFNSSHLYPFAECCAPDIFSGIQNIYYLSGSYFLTPTPITLSGISARSNGQSAQGTSFSSLEKNLFNSENKIKSFSELSQRYFVPSDSIQMYNASIQYFAHSLFSPVTGQPEWKPPLDWILNLLESFIQCELVSHPEYAIDYLLLLKKFGISTSHSPLLKRIYLTFLGGHSQPEPPSIVQYYSLKTFKENPHLLRDNMISLQHSGCLSAYQAVLFYQSIYSI